MLLFTAIMLPILGSILIALFPGKYPRTRQIIVLLVVLLTSVFALSAVFTPPEGRFPIVLFVNNLSLSLRLDGLGRIFGGLVAVLWPMATLYAFEYMKHDSNPRSFFMFYTMTYGVTLGIAFSEDMLTMYFFYELLTLCTLPLVLHTRTREAVLASRKYLYYSLGGAAFAFLGLVYLMMYGVSVDFQLGGVLTPETIVQRGDILLVIYVIAFLGFSVKAAMFPFSGWLPTAGVAPTPVTALLHAVAVVKAGAFALIRLTYYSFGADFLRGTWAQSAVMGLTILTIIYGCSRALKETHFKRRLAWSTVSNLSYILFGVTIMTPLGLAGAITHLVCHAFMKITGFFCAGAVIHQTERQYVHQLNGLGRSMPAIFGCFTVASLALMGVPGLAGFISKWSLAQAAIQSGSPLAAAGAGALLISALLTACYLLSIVVRAFFPPADFDERSLEGVRDPGWMMLVPIFLLAGVVIFLGLCSTPLLQFIAGVAGGQI